MRNLVHVAIVATLAIGVAANSHQHLHHHAKKDAASKIEVATSTETVYIVGETVISEKEALAGINNGSLVNVGESTPIFAPPVAQPPKPTTTTSLQNLGAQFLEKSSSVASLANPTTTSQPPPPPKSTQAPKPSTSPSNPPSGDIGLDSKFPSGQIECSEFPSDYGALRLDYLKLGGYSGIQIVDDDFSMEESKNINTIRTGVPNDKCTEGAMCSYACPPGYQKSQWPDAQGANKQSIGGLYCNKDGYLELTRKSNPVLCVPGAGGVSIKNDLDEVVSTCRTDYPGTESMTIPAEAMPGKSVVLTNPDSSTYYKWNNMPTTAQYYVNNKGLAAKDACLWNCPCDENKPQNYKTCGNWAPVNIGVGLAEDGNNTYIAIFQNAPTQRSAKLNFNIEITGDVNSKCGYKDGEFTTDGKSTEGCTTAMSKGGKAVIRYYS
ncbi:putative secreted beta-glucosidase SUN4 [Metarhizium acridum]|uniref:putative secreted beta-glucosidase SUN4 n=1 Tax=Metarhizium acridum TaxID=92637 RepID=UPI001C6B9FEE|nr:putative secreted beta-glucosidase SUN4 [Metarhizium acridum]